MSEFDEEVSWLAKARTLLAAAGDHFPFLAINGLGITAFLMVASHFWIERELADVVGANIGAAFGWFLFAVPIFGIFLLADLAWLLAAIRQADGSDRASCLVVGALVLAAWIAALLIDNAHHGV